MSLLKPWTAAAVAYAVFAAVDLVAVATGHDGWRTFSKPSLMPALAATVVLATPQSWNPARIFLVVALLFGAAADTALLETDDGSFSLGTRLFALGHIAYVACFRYAGNGEQGLVQRYPLLVLPYALAWLGATIVLWPHFGGFIPLLIPYSLLLTGMACYALNLVGRFPQRPAVLVAAGAVCFMSSDTNIAIARFDPALAPPGVQFIIMLLYIAGQALIAGGIAWGLNLRERDINS